WRRWSSTSWIDGRWRRWMGAGTFNQHLWPVSAPPPHLRRDGSAPPQVLPQKDLPWPKAKWPKDRLQEGAHREREGQCRTRERVSSGTRVESSSRWGRVP